ncbi:hypothetical protein GCM10009623_38430 [Nocardioides aestuarii]|uniref:Uncharacterized protein n=1 Tax=Nocardioides aestuarii TaxID=252231 RepID=A0ABW4TUR2_9ACTN
MHVTLARFRTMLMALLVVMTGMVVLAGPASAHQGTISVSSKTCVTGSSVQVTYKVTWANVPANAQDTHIYSKTGTTTFNSAWDDSKAAAAGWATTDRGAVGSASGERSWTVTLNKSQFGGTGSANGPWEYAYFPWTNGTTSSMYHDTRVEGMDWNACVSIPEDFYICHATGNATSPEGVTNWVTNWPSDSGQVSGHVGAGHQNGLDIIPPVPGLLPNGQNWTAYGQNVHSLGCQVPVSVNVTFTDQSCQGTTYVPPAMNAPTVEGTTKQVTGSVAPGQSVTVTYSAKNGYGIIGQSSFSHTFLALPSSAAYCDRPTDQVVHDSKEGCSLVQYGDFQPGIIRRTGVREYVWNANQNQWVLEAESGISWNAWTQATGDVYSNQQYFSTCAPAQPEPVKVDDTKDGCDLSQYGEFDAGVIRRSGVREYVWNLQARAWELEPASGIAWGPWTQTAGDVYTDTEYFEECAPGQPEPKPVTDTEQGCDLSAYGDFEAGVIGRTGEQEYVWNATSRAWELEPAAAIAWNPWTQAAGDAWDDSEYFAECAPDQPQPEPVSDAKDGCDLSYYGDFDAGVIRRTGLQDYVWDAASRDWVLEDTSLISWNAWTQSADDVYTDAEYFTECAPEQPKDKSTHQDKDGCDLSYYGDFQPGAIERDGVQAYLWNAATRQWELGQVAWGPWTQASSYSDEEYQQLCAPGQPDAEPLSDSAEGCDLSQYGDFEAGVIGRTGEQPYVWDLVDRQWELGDEIWGDWSQTSSYTDEEFYELCAPGQPDAEPLSDSAEGCDLSQYGDFEAGVIGRTGEQPYVWDLVDRQWELGDEIWGDWSQTSSYTDEEFYELCATGQPEPIVREVAGVQASCRIGGVTTWVDTYTTPYVWNSETRAWELGEETGPVRSDEQFTQYTDAQLARLCTEVKGEQEEPMQNEQPGIEVKGEQAAVPTEVAAGESGLAGPLGVVHRNPLWLLAIGGGLGLIGFAGSRRRKVADR